MISTVKQLTLGLTVILVVTYILLGTRLQYGEYYVSLPTAQACQGRLKPHDGMCRAR